MPAKSIIEKRLKIMFNRSNCDRKSQLFGNLTDIADFDDFKPNCTQNCYFW